MQPEISHDAMAILRDFAAPPQAPLSLAEIPELPSFPEIAWRGIFSDYRAAMLGTTEASDVAHFLTLWAAIATTLERRVWMPSGEIVYPNAFLCYYGSTGDRKTTAQRRVFQCSLLPEGIRAIPEVGTTEGLSDKLTQSKDGGYLFFWEEFSSLLTRGRWTGSTILEFLTETFDCPQQWGLAYRGKPVILTKPTPSILTATTPEWFWKNARAEDFFGGFGNRILFLTGVKKEPIPHPSEPDEAALVPIRSRIAELRRVSPQRAVFSASAAKLWEEFYCDQERTERGGLVGAALKRLHVYVRKLAIVYGACERTLPEVTFEQLLAAIGVGVYAADCTTHLIDSQRVPERPEAVLEERFMKWVRQHPGAKKREMQQTMSKYASCEIFNRVLLNLTRADQIEITPEGRVYLSIR